MTQPQIVLASGSPQRRMLLQQAGYEFEVTPPRDSAECGVCSNGGPAELVAELATRKALDVAARLRASQDSPDVKLSAPPRVVIGCDTVAECGGQILGKPVDEEHARSMLQRLSGSVHRVYSGLCVCWVGVAADSSACRVRTAISELEMDSISDAQLDAYLESGLWRGKAGAFGLQDREGWLRLQRGSESNVIGLPLELLAEMLAEILGEVPEEGADDAQ